jgi:hypothetical protein
MPYFTKISTYESHRDILASNHKVIATYTLDSDYVTEVTLADGSSRKVLWEGQVLAVNPTGRTVVPNYTTYGFSALGVLLQMADVTDGDDVVPVVFHGDVIEDYCTDNGTFGTVLSATKNALQHRIQFVSEPRL